MIMKRRMIVKEGTANFWPYDGPFLAFSYERDEEREQENDLSEEDAEQLYFDDLYREFNQYEVRTPDYISSDRHMPPTVLSTGNARKWCNCVLRPGYYDGCSIGLETNEDEGDIEVSFSLANETVDELYDLCDPEDPEPDEIVLRAIEGCSTKEEAINQIEAAIPGKSEQIVQVLLSNRSTCFEVLVDGDTDDDVLMDEAFTVAEAEQKVRSKIEQEQAADYDACMKDLRQFHDEFGGEPIGRIGRFSNGEALYQKTELNESRKTMKKLNITKKQYQESKYFQKKYGKLTHVSESGKVFKTSKGNVLKFNESSDFLNPAESELVESIFDAMSKSYRNYELDFADNGRELHVTNKETNECFTVIVKQDE